MSANAQITAAGDVTIDKNFQRIVKNGEKRNIVFYGAHEIGMHRLMQLAPVEGQAFIDAMIQYKNKMLPYGAVTETQGKKAAYARQKVGLSVDKAMEEVSADAIFRLYNYDTDAFKNALDSVANGKNEKAKVGAKKFKDILNDIIEKLKTLWNKLRGKGEDQVRAEVKQTIDEMEHLRELFEKALGVAAERVRAEQTNPTNKTAHEAGRTDDGSGTMFSKKNVAREFQRKFTGEVMSVDGIALSSREVSSILHALKTGYGKIDAGGRRGGVHTFDYYYLFEVTRNNGVLITDAIDNVDYNIHNERNGGVYDEAGRYDHSSGEGIEGSGRGSRHSTERFSASSKAGESGADDRMVGAAQGRDTGGDQRQVRGTGKKSLDELSARLAYLTKQLKRSNLSKDKKTEIRREQAAIRKELRDRIKPYGAKLQLSSDTQYGYFDGKDLKSADAVTYDAQGNVIPLSKRFNDTKNDIRYSLKDSTGADITEEQAEYFKNSKVRDKEGNLLVMYQGGNSDFTVFDRKKSRHSNLYGRGFYFTESEGHARQYGGVRPFYLNITNPVSTTETTISKSQLRKFLQTVAENEEYSFENYGYNATVDSVLQSVYGKSDFAMLYDAALTAVGDMVETVELFNEVNGTDFDGLILDTETVTFRSEQAKNTDNLKPTDDPDVRYSLKGNGFQEDKYFARQMDSWDKLSNGTRVKVGITLQGSALNRVGLPASGMYFDVGKIKKAMADHNDHLTPSVLKGIPDLLNDPIVIVEYKGARGNIKNTVNVYGNLLVGDSPVVVGVVMHLDRSGRNVISNIRTIHARKDFTKQITDETVLYLNEDKKRTRKWFQVCGNLNVPLEGTRYGFIRSIAFEGNAVKGEKIDEVSSEHGSFSLKEQSDIMQENAKLKQVNQALREQFKVTKFGTVDKKSLNAYTKKLLKDYESGADIEETRELFADLYEYMQKVVEDKTPADEDTWAVIQKKAYDAAVHILENSVQVDDTLWQETKEIRNILRTTGITINKMYDHDLIGYESINEFRKANFGRIKIVNEGVPLDVFYDELCSMYPGYFDDSIYTQPDQLMAIEKFLERIKPTEVNMFSYDMRNAATMMATDIIERVYALPQAKPTFADKKNAQIAAAKAQGDQKARDAYLAGAMRQGRDMAKAATAERERMETQIAAAKKNIDDFRQKVKDVRKQEKAAKWEAVDKVKKHYQAKEAKMSENRKAQILRAQVVRHAQGLSKKLLRGTDKQHIPQGLQGAVAELLAAINLESGYTYDPASNSYKKSDAGLPTKRTEEFLRVKAQYEAIAANNDYDMVLDPSLLGVPAEGIPSMLDKVIAMKDIRIVDMTISQLNTILDVVRAIEHSITTAGKMLTRSKWARTSEAAAAFMADTATRRAKRSLTERHYMLDIETPYTFFSHFGEAGHDFFRMLREAQDAEQTMQDQVVDRVGKVVSEEARKKAEKETVEFTTAATGEKLTLSKAHMMELYLLSKRPQALNHLLRGGIIQPKVGKVRRGTETIKLTELDLAKITSELTDEERKIADGLQKITLLLAEWGNKASLQAYGYEKFKDPNYWTIKFASEGISQDVEKGQNKPRSISNMGSAKSVVPEASNTLDIGGIFNTFDQHVSDMLTYSAWLTTMEDANRLFNYKFRDENWNLTGKNMKALLNKYGGDGSTQYWLRLMEDIQNGLSVVSDTSTENIATKTIGSVKKASVAGNLRVVVQQPTAYLRALAVLDADSMAVALGKNTVVKPMLDGWEKAVKYAPIAARKAAGGFEISSNPRQLAEIMYKPESKLGKAKDVAKEAPLWMAGKMDQVTWGTIWNACEHQIGKNKSNLTKGSLDFYEAVAELFTEVIDQTQVVDGVLQRSQVMRSGSNFMKQMTSFTGEPTQAANVVIRAWDKLRYETDPKKRSEAIKGLSRAVSAYMITSILNAFAQSLVDVLRDDDDEKGYWEKVWAAFSGINGKEETWKDFCRNILLASNAMNNINPATWLPIWKDVFSLLQGYSVKRMDAATIEDFIDSVGNAMKSFSGEGNYTIGYATLKTLVAGGKIFGSSAYNILRDVEGAVRTFIVATDDLMAQYNTEKLITKPMKNKNKYMKLLFEAYENDKNAYNYIREDLLASGYMTDELENAVDSHKEKAALAGTGYKSSKDAYDALYDMKKDGRKTEYNKLRKTLLDAEYQNVRGREEHPFTEGGIDTAMHSRKLSEGVREMGYATTDGVYDSMYDNLLDGDMGDYYKFVVTMMGLDVESSDIESAMRSRAKADGLSVDDLTEPLAAGGFKPKYPVESGEDFGIDDLTSSQYTTYSKSYGEMVDDVIDDFIQNGFNDMEPGDANKWLGSAYSYARETALEIATGGKYDSEMDWINDAQAAEKQGVSVADYIMVKEAFGASSAQKMAEAADYGISAEMYMDFRDTLAKYDKPTKNGKYGTFTQDEARAAIKAMPGLTRQQRAYLWQSLGSSWSLKNNPWR